MHKVTTNHEVHICSIPNVLEAIVRRISARDCVLEVEISLPGKSITFGILQQYLVSTSRKKGSSECGASDP
jgi:hypothetical protein